MNLGIIGTMSTRNLLLTIGLALLLAACASGTGAPAPASVTETPPPPTATPGPPTATPAPLAASVNGEGILLAEFQAELARYQSVYPDAGDEKQASETVLNDLIDQTLLAQAAADAGFSLDEAAFEARIDALAAQLGSAQALTDWQAAHGYDEAGFRLALRRSIAAAWMRDKIITEVPSTAEQVHVRQILLYNETAAQNVLNQLQSGSEFDELAALYDPLTRGDLGWFPRGYIYEKVIEEAAFSLEPGTYSQVLQSGVGFHIVKVIEREPARSLSADALRALQSRSLADWLAERRAAANIVTNP